MGIQYNKLIDMLWLYEQTREKMLPFCGLFMFMSDFTFVQKVKQIIGIFRSQINAVTNMDKSQLNEDDDESKKKRERLIQDAYEKMDKIVLKFDRILFIQ